MCMGPVGGWLFQPRGTCDERTFASRREETQGVADPRMPPPLQSIAAIFSGASRLRGGLGSQCCVWGPESNVCSQTHRSYTVFLIFTTASRGIPSEQCY